MGGTFPKPSCGKNDPLIHSIPYSLAQPLERGSNNYYSIIQGMAIVMEEKELLKVFIVDDDRDVRMGMFNGVNWEELGFLPTGQAENGVEAIEKIKETPHK